MNQNFAAKALLNRTKHSSAAKALKDLNWITLEDRRKVHLGVFVHKALKGQSSRHSANKISSLIPKHKYATRQKTTRKLECTQHRSALVERSVFYRAMNVWNSIPPLLRNIDTTISFKNKYQTRLLESYKRNDH